MANIKVKNLDNEVTTNLSNKLMLLTDNTNNVVKNINIKDFTDSLVSTEGNNSLTSRNGRLHVDTTQITPLIKELTSDTEIELESDTVNKLTLTQSVTFVLPTVTDNTYLHQILVQVYKSDIAYEITLSNDLSNLKYFGELIPETANAGYYDIIYTYDSIGGFWCCSAIKKG